jgi:hypothetical protein
MWFSVGKMRKIILVGFITAVCLFGASNIHAQCSCLERDVYFSAYDELKGSDVVFVGKVTEVKKVGVSGYDAPSNTMYYEFDVKFKIKMAWKNDLPRTITIRNVGSKSAEFVQGESYLIYGRVRYDDNILRANLGCCNRSKRLSEAAEDLKEFTAKGEKLMKISKTSTSNVGAKPNKSLQPTRASVALIILPCGQS